MRVCIVGASGKLGRYMVDHVGDPILASNRTRRVDFALFMVEALTADELVHEAPAIVGCRTPSPLAHAATAKDRAGALAGAGHRRTGPKA